MGLPTLWVNSGRCEHNITGREVSGQGGRTLEINGHVFMTKARHIVIIEFGCGHHKQPGQDFVRPNFGPRYTMNNRPIDSLIPDRSQPEIKMAAPTAGHWT